MTTNAERALTAVEADILVATDPFTVAWLTGFQPDATSGPSPFATAAVAVVRDGETMLICSTDEASSVDPARAQVRPYEGYTIGQVDPPAGAAAALRELRLSGRIAVESGSLPNELAEILGSATVDVGGSLRRLRAIKMPTEIVGIRRAIGLCDVGQAAAREALAVGMTELELWSVVHGAMELAAGERLPLLADLVSGTRAADTGGGPSDRVIAESDLVICDLVPRIDGLWGDSCSTLAAGTPLPGVVDAHAQAVETLELLISQIDPGMTAGQLDAIGRGSGLGYPHHTGHGVGVSYHEEPRIVPDSDLVLEPGMVIALEPGCYHGTWGLRVERVVLVTETGCEVISKHAVDL